MHGKQATEHARRPWRIAVVLCCALLLIFSTTIQLAHIHTPAGVSHAGCALCATAHVVISPTAPATAPFAATPTATQVVDLQPTFAHRSLDFSLYTRPPPVDLA